ncbi:unnamed protein product [Spirodela intermedia]|uniref:Uncharacterized protein n=1 Tax=Spirodela intermedia TaxID=51605 RepID=A0A7I8KPN3_SPIIN|nr:unnamed protein product [Spirodela intermedia]
MKKYRGFRLGRRLAFIWRSLHQPPSKHRGYLRLSSDGPTHRKRDPTKEMEEKNAVAARIAHWGRCLAQRLCQRRHRLLGNQADGDEKEEILRHRNVPKPPPRGHLAVYVGREGVDPLYRVMVPVVFFNHPLFGELLKSAQEEFGFCRSGGIVIPCPISDFESVRRRVAAAAGVRYRHSGNAEPGVWES